jgi:hypothetical protein
MSRVRNADEFLIRFRNISDDYEQIFGPVVSRLRATYVSPPHQPCFHDRLEIHARTYYVNAFLAALNWRLDKNPTDDLPNLAEEVAVRSTADSSTRFLDYLGFEGNCAKPLLIVETKRPGYPLPRASTETAAYSEIICRGLAGEPLLEPWNQWLNSLRDYVRRVQQTSQVVPKRVVITDGEWMILFLDPQDAFLNTGRPVSSNILVYQNREAIEWRFDEVFRNLEYQRVAGTVNALVPSELPHYVTVDQVYRVLHGLHLLYTRQRGIYREVPVIKVAPVLFLMTRHGSWLRVESPPQEFKLPENYNDITNHIQKVQDVAQTLLNEVNRQLRAHFEASPLSEHYEDEDSFAVLPGVLQLQRDEFLLVTGDQTHYLLPRPSVPNCPYHDWHSCEQHGVPSYPGPILNRSLCPRSFFVSGELHHCAHRDVSAAKACSINAANRSQCGARSGRDGQAFCELWRFEEHLCCRTCAFEQVCTRAQAFNLPCSSSTR